MTTLWTVAGLQANEPLPTAHAAEHADIGRVFMSPAERRELDRLRKLEPEQTSGPGVQNVTAEASASSSKEKARAAGYIVPSNGLPYTWSDGDFRRSTNSNIDIPQLPGAVSIIRHRGKDVPATSPAKEAEKETTSESVSVPENGNDDAD